MIREYTRQLSVAGTDLGHMTSLNHENMDRSQTTQTHKRKHPSTIEETYPNIYKHIVQKYKHTGGERKEKHEHKERERSGGQRSIQPVWNKALAARRRIETPGQQIAQHREPV